jgi:hypothetical protein
MQHPDLPREGGGMGGDLGDGYAEQMLHRRARTQRQARSKQTRQQPCLTPQLSLTKDSPRHRVLRC